MIKKILSTTLTRILGAVISLLIVVINARVLGAAGVGHIGLVILDITIINLVSGYFGSAALVYFTPRTPTRQLLLLSFISSFIGPVLFYFFYLVVPFSLKQIVLFDSLDLMYVLSISFALTFASNLMSIILGKQKIFIHNILTILQLITLALLVLLSFYINNSTSVYVYFDAFLISNILVLVVSLSIVFTWVFQENNSKKLDSNLLKDIFKYSLWTQTASILQMFNYRLPYYFLQASVGNSGLGVFTNANQIAEGLWIPSKSIAMVQYSKISNNSSHEYNSKLTIKLLKFSFILTLILSIVVVMFPPEFYVFVFKHKEFAEIRDVLLILIPGILCMVVTMITNHYFSGIGKPRLNFLASFVSLLFMIVSSIFLIKTYGLIGAAWASTITYGIGAIISTFYFLKISNTSFSDLLITKNDLQSFRSIFLKKSF